jgi:hypothetical protein
MSRVLPTCRVAHLRVYGLGINSELLEIWNGRPERFQVESENVPE